MSLTAGTKLGPYEIVASIGAGGMGEVYRARDTRLERTVAIKILPAEIQSSPERRQRFEREAKAISSLQHPHICVLHDIGCHDGMDYLVMEYLEGESLADRLRRGPLPTEQTLKLGIEIAEALEKAHKQGLVHRDLKPGNVMLTKSGAKLLDFGLAKPAGVIAAAASGEFDSATLTIQRQHPVTAQGVIVGTFQYMSPEQIQGKEADARSDIFSLGALLYECATGRPAFTGKSQISLMSAILERQPESVSVLNVTSPAALEYVIRTCLQKDPDDRFQTAHDVSLQLKWIAGSTTGGIAVAAPPRRKRWMALAGWVSAAVLFAVLGAVWFFRPAPNARVTRFAIALPPKVNLPVDAGTVSISADGQKIAYNAAESGKSRLFIRSIDRFDAVAVPDSEGAGFPFFSPDGEMVAFFARGRLKKVATNGGSNPVTITDLPAFYGGQWLEDGSILVASSFPSLLIIPQQGGASKAVPVPAGGKLDPGSPIMLPGGKWILFTDDKVSSISIVALRPDTGEIRLVVPNASQPRYIPGYLVYYTAGGLSMAPLDARNARVTGPAVVIVQDVAARNYFAHFDVSQNGTLVYAPGLGTITERDLVWVDRSGKATKIDAAPEDYVDPSISPDGKYFVVCLRRLAEQSFGVYDISRGLMMRMGSNNMRSVAPVWAPDGKTLYFDGSGQNAKLGIYRMPADGSSPPTLVREMPSNAHLTSISGDHASLMLNDPTTNTDLWMLSLDGRDMKPFRKSSAIERQGSFSPDGKYIAYTSDESGRPEVYVEQIGGGPGRWQISTDGGEQPRWSRKGNEIFYRNGTKMMAVAVQLAPFSAAKAVELFDLPYDRGGAVPGYDVTPDGQRFLMTMPQHPNPTEIRVVVGWPEELKKGAAR